MTSNPRPLCQYQIIADITHTMHVHARQGDWDHVLELAPKYHQAVQGLRDLAALSRTELEERRELLSKILANDAAIRRLASPELDRLGTLITNLQRQRNVLQAYYAPHT